MGFVDGHAALVKLQNLWTYYWHQDWKRPSITLLENVVRGFIIMRRILSVLLWVISSTCSRERVPSFQQIGNTLVMSNGDVRLEYNLECRYDGVSLAEFAKNFRLLRWRRVEQRLCDGQQLQQPHLVGRQQQ